MRPLVSIIIPVYKVEDYIEDSILSVLNQTYKNIEIVLIDDRGGDKSLELARQLIKRHNAYNRLKVITHEKNRGLSAARNTGLINSSGQYVFFMDSDDEIPTNCIENLIQEIQSSKADFVLGNMKLVGAKSVHIKTVTPGTKKKEEILEAFSKESYSVAACGKLYRKDFLIDNQLFFKEGLIHEDVLFQFHVTLKAQCVSIISEVTYIYKIRNVSITRNKISEKRINDLVYIVETIYSTQYEGNRKYIDNYLSRWIFLIKLLLTVSELTQRERKLIYDKISKLNIKNNSMMWMLTKNMNYHVFNSFFSLPYKIYKFINSKR